ncbi:MAG: hypothetical protein JSU73_00020 [candidate division WOR-3 bacterium]|nr:MAG: hypothetical protein JSU73_00020 [candidate division WOR-3 bacterium]
MRRMTTIAVAALVFAVAGCGLKATVPPRLDLGEFETIGIIDFECSNEGELGPYATTKFIEWIRRDQGMVRIVELGSEEELLEELGLAKLGKEAFEELAEMHGLYTVITGELTIFDVRPDITIAPGFGFMDFSAEVDAVMSVRLVEAETGASLWSNSAQATRRVAGVSIFGRSSFAFDARDPEEAYGELVEALVKKTSRDFRETWEWRCCP